MAKQLKGDIDNDGKITDLDAVICLTIAAEAPGFSEQEKERADVNNDGTVSIKDARKILQHIAGIELIDEVIDNGI